MKTKGVNSAREFKSHTYFHGEKSSKALQRFAKPIGRTIGCGSSPLLSAIFRLLPCILDSQMANCPRTQSTMSAHLEQPIVLRLNSAWQPIGTTSPRQAIVAMCGGIPNERPALAMDIYLDDGGNLVNAIPTDWEHWQKLPVRPGDTALLTSRGQIRCPTVLINPRFNKMPKRLPRLTKQAVLARDGFTCAYTGKKLDKKTATVDHVIPRHHGGKDSWDNLVACDKETNFKKGSRLNEEIGLTLLRKPKAPQPIPVSATIKSINHSSWKHFIQK